MKTIGLILILCFVFCVSSAEGQKRHTTEKPASKETAGRSSPVTCGGGVVNGRATYLPTPEYSKKAKNAGASGQVTVQIKIDEEGNVIEAKACSGNPLLRDSAVEAALQAKFKPTVLSGIPVKVSGIVIYTFSPEIVKDDADVVILSCSPSVNIIKVLNGYTIDLVKPEYPQELKGRRISGAVNIQVTITKMENLFPQLLFRAIRN
ncbi:MAG: energy transducer TonB [Acidobacteriota bacterium]